MRPQWSVRVDDARWAGPFRVRVLHSSIVPAFLRCIISVLLFKLLLARLVEIQTKKLKFDKSSKIKKSSYTKKLQIPKNSKIKNVQNSKMFKSQKIFKLGNVQNLKKKVQIQ
jgi:hypothetical protein